MADDDDLESAGDAKNPVVQTHKVYVKDVSYEAPGTPESFKKPWRPALTVELDHQIADLGDDLYEVALKVTATMKNQDAVAYLVEVDQAGIFLLKNVTEEKLFHLLNVYCLRVLYPYASAFASDIITRAGFPQLFLAPVSFEALYNQRIKQAQEGAG